MTSLKKMGIKQKSVVFLFLSWRKTWCVLNINTGLGFMFGFYCNNKQSLTWTWGQQVSELLLITRMNKVINTVTQQLQLLETKEKSEVISQN